MKFVIVEITRELNKKSPIHLYTTYTWSVLTISNPTLMSMHYP